MQAKELRPRATSQSYDLWTCNRLMKKSTEDPTTGCLLWNGPLNKVGGYGRIWYREKSWRTHRLFYTLMVSDIPEGMDLMHCCDNPRCINPNHLRPGTHSENIKEAYTKGRKTTPQGTKHPRFRLSLTQVKEVFESSESSISLAKRFGVSASAIYRLRNGSTWKSLERNMK